MIKCLMFLLNLLLCLLIAPLTVFDSWIPSGKWYRQALKNFDRIREGYTSEDFD